MLCLGWIFLWLVSGERIKGFDISDCSTKKHIWTYYAGREETFVLFCDLPEPSKSHFSHRSQLLPTQAPPQGPCGGGEDLADVQWYLQSPNGDPRGEITNNYPHIIQHKSALHFTTIGVNDTGSYICRPRIRNPQDEAYCIKIVLEVKPQKNISCMGSVSHKQDLLFGSIASIYCPSLSCQHGMQSPELTWYHNRTLLSDKRSNPIQVVGIYACHQGTYVCDYTQSDNASSWTVRAVVQVQTIVKNTNSKPVILEPVKDTLEAELGKPLTLNCRVQFGFEKDFAPVVRWYSQDSNQKLEVLTPEGKSVKSTLKDREIQCVVHLKEVTERDLHRRFICFAQNSVGNATQSTWLKEKKGVVFLYILLGTAMALVGLLTAIALTYLYWIEVVLFCRTYQSKDETLGDKKEFDAFVSYAKWSSFESEDTSSLSEENLALNLLPEVLENKYGYTLCLLERDVAPGGVYAEDIVSIIKKSRRGIFILSPDYVNGPSVFELQAAVNLALDDQTLKLILIKFRSFKEPESLPHLVKRALKVLPTVTWRGLKSVPPNSRFWAQMHYHMPVKKSKGFLRTISELSQGHFTGKDSVRQKPLGGAPGLGKSGNGPSDLLPAGPGQVELQMDRTRSTDGADVK